MPYFWRRPYPRNYWRRRRRNWFRTRRTGPFIRRRRRRRYRVRKPFYYRKLKTIKIREWQPRTVKLCKIKGYIPLIICGRDRQTFNFMQYYSSIPRVGQPSGGGWSSIVFSLSALYQQFQRLMNWWTKDNDGLPLTRYLGCKFIFYRSWDTDYIVTWQTCPPMTDTEYKHLNSHPYRQLLTNKNITVPNLVRHQYRHNYVKKRFPPPSLLYNKWYFQQDICNTELLMLTTTAVNLDQFWIPNNEVSNTITFLSLNTNVFQNPNFHNPGGTQGYNPKSTYILWGSGNGTQQTPPNFEDLIYLGDTNHYKLGDTKNRNSSQPPQPENLWGNPFYPPHSHHDTVLYYSTKMPTSYKDKQETTPKTHAQPIYVQCRYNPLADTGEGNEVYFKSTSISKNEIHTAENNPDILITGFPIWLILWGWPDWIEKAKPINQIALNYYLVIKSRFITPQLPGYVPLDEFFTHLSQDQEELLTETDKNYWHPRWGYQQKTVNTLGNSGPATPKINKSQSVQVNARYTFYFKWGGCPAPMQHIKDPCEQPKFPVPNNFIQTIQVTDPATEKTTLLYDFDQRRDELTDRATKRLKKAKDTKTTIFPDLLNPKIETQVPSEISSEEEEEISQTITDELLRVRRKRHKLQRKLNKLICQ
ncbi:ORF1 [Anelloviridae sp.]|nr:ORF1 [Anelloviridae sp.]